MSEAWHGAEALQLIEQAEEPFELVVTDVVMPVTSGYKLGRRPAEQRPGLAVLYMSGYPTGEMLRCGLPPIPTPFLRKPVLPDELVLKVAELPRPLV